MSTTAQWESELAAIRDRLADEQETSARLRSDFAHCSRELAKTKEQLEAARPAPPGHCADCGVELTGDRFTLDVCAEDWNKRRDAKDWRAVAEKLWCLLDDIDTASDATSRLGGGGAEAFRAQALRIAAKRGEYFSSDGHSLFPVKT